MFYFPSTYREYFYLPTIRADTRDPWRLNNQRDFTDLTDSHAEKPLDRDGRTVRASFINWKFIC